jgi:hypothetical protein
MVYVYRNPLYPITVAKYRITVACPSHELEKGAEGVGWQRKVSIQVWAAYRPKLYVQCPLGMEYRDPWQSRIALPLG